eukprot:1637489-Amphidinium_carterae.1
MIGWLDIAGYHITFIEFENRACVHPSTRLRRASYTVLQTQSYLAATAKGFTNRSKPGARCTARHACTSLPS